MGAPGTGRAVGESDPTTPITDTHFDQPLSHFSEPVETGHMIQKYKDLAKELGVVLSLGGFQETVPSNPKKRYNSHLIISENG